MSTLDDFTNLAGVRLDAAGLVYGSERRRTDCVAWITDVARDVKAMGWGETEAAARFDAYEKYRAEVAKEREPVTRRGGYSEAEVAERAAAGVGGGTPHVERGPLL